jgi:hypothetical protein
VPSQRVQQTPSEEGHDVGTLPDPRFPIRPWGYERAAVDAYVEQARGLLAEALTARTPEGAVKAALDRLGDETSAVLQNAHEIADEITARSREEADRRLQRTEDEAASMLQAAEDRVAALDAEVERLWNERQRLLTDMDRISEDLHALVVGADERFPVEEEAAAAGQPTEAGEEDAVDDTADADAESGAETADTQALEQDPGLPGSHRAQH